MLFAARRAAQHAGQSAMIGVVVAVLGGALAATAAIADRTIDTGTARLVADADPIAQSVVVDAPAGVADDAISAAIDDAFAASQVTVRRTTWSTAPSPSGGVVLLADPAIADVATLDDGAWPAGPTEVAAATVAGIEPALIDGMPVTTSGTWHAKDAAAVAWAQHPAVASGTERGNAGPVLVSPAFLTEHGHGVRANWTISAAGPVAVDQIPAYRAGIARLANAFDELEGVGVRTSGGWDATLARAAGAAAVARGVLSVPVALQIVMGALVLGVLARASGAARARESHLLTARGASTGAVVAETAAAGAVLFAAAAAVAAGIGMLAGGAVGPVLVWAVATAAGAGILVTAVGTSAALAAPETRGDVSRRAVAATAVAAVFAAIVAGLSVWQLLGSGLTVDGRADAAAAAAPALTIILAALVVALLAGPVAAVGERLARPTRGLATVLALRRIARQASTVLAGVLALALAAGALAFATMSGVRSRDVVHAQVAQIVGADVRGVYDVSPIVDGPDPVLSAGAVDAPGADVFAALRAPVTIGQTDAQLVALVPGELAAATGIPAAQLSGDTPRALDGDLELDVVAAGSDATLHPRDHVGVRAWLVDPYGSARWVEAGAVPLDGTRHRLTVDVSAGDALFAVEARGSDVQPGVSVQFTVRSGGTERGMPLAVTISDQTPQPRAVTVDDVDAPLPVVVTRSLATRLALRTGDAIAVRLGTLARPIDGRVAAVQDGLPGVGTIGGVAVDLDGLIARALAQGGSVPAPGQLWAHTSDVAATSAALRAVADQPVQIVTAASIGSAALIDPVLALVAAGVALVALLAAAAFAAVSAGVVRGRRDEAVPLRSFGFTTARQRRTAAIELAATAGFALVLGTAAGLAIALWLGPALTAALTVGGVT